MQMVTVTVKKTQFAGLNNKRFYCHYGIASLPFGHPLLEEVRKEKKDLKKKHSSSHQWKKNWAVKDWSVYCSAMWKIKSVKINFTATANTL